RTNDTRGSPAAVYSYEQYRDKKLIINFSNHYRGISAYREGDFSSLIAQENRLVTTAAGPLGRAGARSQVAQPSIPTHNPRLGLAIHSQAIRFRKTRLTPSP